jgi:hypothetical protein
MLSITPDADLHCSMTKRQQRLKQFHQTIALPIYALPTEIILNIIHQATISQLPSLISGLYHLLVNRGIVPNLSPSTLVWARGLLTWPLEMISTNIFFPRLDYQLQLPLDLTLEIEKYLRPEDKINLVLAIYQIPTENQYSKGFEK